MARRVLPALAVIILAACCLRTCMLPGFVGAAQRTGRALRVARMAEAPLTMVVEVVIKPDRIDDFLAALKVDAEGSRKEEGCLRFDLLRDKEDANKFVFYEVYKDAEAAAVHKETPHYKAWADFKATGGVVSQTALKMDGIDFTY
eukprot:gb/GFBE01051627.1/.p1 GENE.gb/GFBE01051627.1/~~gb/GFBE01051627.1/.p1  ORF type:complete len:145 (+),score=38.51 gb/GFBE01051627.1/:1-435(+)